MLRTCPASQAGKAPTAGKWSVLKYTCANQCHRGLAVSGAWPSASRGRGEAGRESRAFRLWLIPRRESRASFPAGQHGSTLHHASRTLCSWKRESPRGWPGALWFPGKEGSRQFSLLPVIYRTLLTRRTHIRHLTFSHTSQPFRLPVKVRIKQRVWVWVQVCTPPPRSRHLFVGAGVVCKVFR